jgi:DNA modification methylase
MEPYYQDGGITIYHGDCREVMPSLPKVNLVLTDPPYGIGEAAGKNGSRSVLALSRDYGNHDWDSAPPPPDLIDAVVRHGERAILWGGNYFGLPASSSWLVWDKDNGANDFADCELAWANLGGAVRKFQWRWQGMLQENMRRKDARVHPTQKPLALMKWCLEIANFPSTILDPFMGSGTTLRAAKDLGRRAIGIEIEERYCEIAAKRMSQEVLPFTQASLPHEFYQASQLILRPCYQDRLPLWEPQTDNPAQPRH